MIVSYLHNFIFIKTKKTAGTTIEMTLAPHCGPDDIVTPLGKREELLRGNGTPLCRNFTSDRALEQHLRDAILTDSGNKEERQKMKVEMPDRFGSHMGAMEIKTRLAPEFWQKAFKFTAERHPYEKAVSLAYFTLKKAEFGFEEHLDNVIHRNGYSSYRFYSIDDEVVVDDFIRLESLHADLKRIGAKIGIPIPDELPRSKTNRRKDSRPAREILSDEQKAIIHYRCKKEFDLLGYEP